MDEDLILHSRHHLGHSVPGIQGFFFCSFINCGIWDFLTWDGYMYFLGNKWSLSSPEDSLWKYPFMNINCWVIAYRLWIPVLFPIIFFSFTKTVYMSHSPFPLSRGSLSFSVRMKDLKYLKTHILASSSFLRPRVSPTREFLVTDLSPNSEYTVLFTDAFWAPETSWQNNTSLWSKAQTSTVVCPLTIFIS